MTSYLVCSFDRHHSEIFSLTHQLILWWFLPLSECWTSIPLSPRTRLLSYNGGEHKTKMFRTFFFLKKQWNSTLQYSYSEVSEETSTKLVFTRPTSPVASFFPVNQSKHETRSPMMIMTSPGATLSSSGHSASCICVATHFPLAEEVKQQHVSQHLCKGGFSLWNSNKYVFHLCRSAFIFVLPDESC